MIPTVEIATRTVFVRDVGSLHARDRSLRLRCRWRLFLLLALALVFAGCGAVEHHEDTLLLQKQIDRLEVRVQQLIGVYAESSAEVEAALQELRYAREALERYLARQQQRGQ